ncbi:DUF559 domain-containing protein [Rhodothermus marinus]|uniref:DUF559 domain-containing protein n=1 Tax=Rhodothermus marinus TaxID=29549 RepID=UPI0009DAC042
MPVDRSGARYRRRLRKQATPAERRLGACLRKRRLKGRRFRRQHSIGTYVVDSYCPSERLGVVHEDVARACYDAEREAHLRTRGLRVLRFENRQVPEAIRQAFRGRYAGSGRVSRWRQSRDPLRRFATAPSGRGSGREDRRGAAPGVGGRGYRRWFLFGRAVHGRAPASGRGSPLCPLDL